MSGTQCNNVPAGTCIPAIGQGLSVRFRKPDLASSIHCNAETTLVHQSVVVPAEKCQIIHRSFTAIGPMPDVVRIDKACAGTARETAATIAALQRPADGRRYGAGLAPHAERFPIGMLQPVNHSRVAGQAPGRFGTYVPAVFEFCFRPRAVGLERFDIGMHVDQVTVAAVALFCLV